MGDVNPDFGDRVTYIDDDGQPHWAIILEPIPDAEYVTLAAAETANPQEEYVGVHWDIETSVYPHDDTGHDYACGSHAYRPGWE